MKEKFRPAKIISGGQTGVDRAALDAARESAIEIGGWLPAGRLAEDGPLDFESYPELLETVTSDPAERTEKNILAADATLIIQEENSQRKSPGTKNTVEFIQQHNKAHFKVIQHARSPEEILNSLQSWLNETKPKTLNVAGPRHSESPDLYSYTQHLLLRVFERIPSPKADNLLLITTFAVGFSILGFNILQFIKGEGLDFFSPLIFACVAFSIRAGSHSALRFATWFFTPLATTSFLILLWHLLRWKPFTLESGRILPPDSPEFWQFLATPAVISVGVAVLLVTCHRLRRIKFFTRTVKRWTIAAVSLVTLSLIASLFTGIDEGTKPLDSAQQQEFEKVLSFYQKHGSTPPTLAYEKLCKELAAQGQVGHITARLHHQAGTYTSTPFTTHPILGKKVNGWRRGSSLRLTFDDGSVWEGTPQEKVISTTTREWLLIKVYFGDYESSENRTSP